MLPPVLFVMDTKSCILLFMEPEVVASAFPEFILRPAASMLPDVVALNSPYCAVPSFTSVWELVVAVASTTPQVSLPIFTLADVVVLISVLAPALSSCTLIFDDVVASSSHSFPADAFSRSIVADVLAD